MVKKGLFVFIHFLVIIPLVFAQTIDDKPKKVNSLFQKIVQDSITHIVLITNYDSLWQGRLVKDYPKMPATIIFKSAIQSDTMSVKLELRGRYRRKICDVPPIKLDFSKKDLAKLKLNPEYDEIKLVTHCLDEARSNQTLLKEYWTYHLHHILTPNSFKVHLVKINYQSNNQLDTSQEHFAILIENNQEMANRLGGTLVSKFGLTPSKLDTATYHHALMFNYMIGNLDWNIVHQRNVKYVQTDESLIVVPYDFDQSALVYAPYAKPHPDYQQKNLKDRHCIGSFHNKAELEAMAMVFKAKQQQLQVFQQCPYLEENYKQRMLDYLNSFYEDIQNKRRLKRAFLSGH